MYYPKFLHFTRKIAPVLFLLTSLLATHKAHAQYTFTVVKATTTTNATIQFLVQNVATALLTPPTFSNPLMYHSNAVVGPLVADTKSGYGFIFGPWGMGVTGPAATDVTLSGTVDVVLRLQVTGPPSTQVNYTIKQRGMASAGLTSSNVQSFWSTVSGGTSGFLAGPTSAPPDRHISTSILGTGTISLDATGVAIVDIPFPGISYMQAVVKSGGSGGGQAGVQAWVSQLGATNYPDPVVPSWYHL